MSCWLWHISQTHYNNRIHAITTKCAMLFNLTETDCPKFIRGLGKQRNFWISKSIEHWACPRECGHQKTSILGDGCIQSYKSVSVVNKIRHTTSQDACSINGDWHVIWFDTNRRSKLCINPPKIEWHRWMFKSTEHGTPSVALHKQTECPIWTSSRTLLCNVLKLV